MQTEKTMRVTSVREIQDGTSSPTQVEMVLEDANAVMSGMDMQRVTAAIAEQRPVGTRYTVVTTYTEIPA